MLFDTKGALLDSDDDDERAIFCEVFPCFVIDLVGDLLASPDWRVRDYRVIDGVDVEVNVAIDDLYLRRNAQDIGVLFAQFEGPKVHVC